MITKCDTPGRVAALCLGSALLLGVATATQAQAEDRVTWARPGYSNSGNSYVNAGRASFASYGDAFGIYDDAKDGYGLVLEVHATKADGTALDGAHYYYGGGGTSDKSFLVKDLEEGSDVQFRLCMENNRGDTEFACGDWHYTPA